MYTNTRLFTGILNRKIFLYQVMCLFLVYNPLSISLFLIRYKLTDFDISERVPPSGYLCDSRAIGTKEYLAPERVSYKEYSYPVDIWALGCTLYYLCTRRVPYGDCYNVNIHPEPIKGYSAELTSLIERMLDPNPSTRITAEQILTYPSIVSRISQFGITVTSLKITPSRIYSSLPLHEEIIIPRYPPPHQTTQSQLITSPLINPPFQLQPPSTIEHQHNVADTPETLDQYIIQSLSITVCFLSFSVILIYRV